MLQHQQHEQPNDFMIDQGGVSRLISGVDGTTHAGIAISSEAGERQQHSERLAFSLTHRQRHAGGLSKVAGRQHPKGVVGDGHGDGRTLNARESSARFWEEAGSLDAKRSCANNDRGPGQAPTFESGRRDLGGEEGACHRSDGGNKSRRGQHGEQGRTAACVVGGAQQRSVRPAGGGGGGGATGRTAAIGTGDARRKNSRGVSLSPDLPLGQALRIMGGLIGGDGAKLSAVGNLYASLIFTILYRLMQSSFGARNAKNLYHFCSRVSSRGCEMPVACIVCRAGVQNSSCAQDGAVGLCVPRSPHTGIVLLCCWRRRLSSEVSSTRYVHGDAPWAVIVAADSVRQGHANPPRAALHSD